MKTTEVTFYTAPSNWINGITPPPSEYASYDRVAGMLLHGQTLWEDRSRLSRENDYRPTDTEAVTYHLPEKMAANAADYFYDFYVNPLHAYSLGAKTVDRNENSNCHRFGATILTGRPQSFYDSYDIATQAIDKNRLLDPNIVQSAGTLAIVGRTKGEGVDGKHAVHTMVSLGNGDYLQGRAIEGNIGISSLDTMMSTYRTKWPHAQLGIYSLYDARITGSDYFSAYDRKLAYRKTK